MTKKSSYEEYLKTAFLTFLVLIVISTIILVFTRLNAANHISEDDLAMQNDMIGFLITKYKHLEEQNPNNASINLKLGQLYEMLDSYKQAESEYMRALEKRGNNYDAAAFKLAGVYLMNKDFGAAENLIDNIKDTSRYSIIREKGFFYKSYGDALFNENRFSDAITKYDKAVFYLTKINSGALSEVNLARCDAYVAMADYYVNKKQPETSLELLNEASKNCDTPLVNYKLALLNLDKNPERSVIYLEDVQKKDPSIINYNIYKKLLFSLKLQYAYKGDMINSELYDIKLIRLKSFMQRNILTPDEVSMRNYKFRIKKFPIRNEYDVLFDFDIANISNESIPRLYAIIEFYDEKGNKIHEYIHTIATPRKDIMPADDPEHVSIVIRTKKNIIQQYDKIGIRVLLSKNPKIVSQLYQRQTLDVTKGKNTN